MSYASDGGEGGFIRYYEEAERAIRGPRKNPPPKPVQEAEKTVEEELLAHLAPLIEDHFLTDVVRPIKSGKEAVVYCCRADASLGRDLVAAKVYRPLETRSFKRDTVYQQGRDRGSRPDARVLRALGKKTQHGRTHKFSAWIAHEMKTLEILHAAGAGVPEPIERNGPVILMEYFGDIDNPAPVLLGVDLDAGEAARLYAGILRNVELFLVHHRIHADLSAYNMLYWDGAVTIIDFPQSVDPRYNDDAFDLLVRDLKTVNGFFAAAGADIVDPTEYALRLWRTHVDPRR
ncbi:MAG: hypothetical protein PHU43_05065 [Candidatus Bipolaricaulis sp.]|nr:hypothetical protein [Candidatus Bipolaricaulis sp.]